MPTQRELDLREWAGVLPVTHKAFREYVGITEALEAHKRVLDGCEKALESSRYRLWELGVTESENEALWKVRQALAAIAELKTNGKIG